MSRAGTLAHGEALSERRSAFLRRTYHHLFGALSVFVLVEVALFRSGIAYTMAGWMRGVSWMWILGGFMIVAWFASHQAHRTKSLGAQYAALGLFVLAEAAIFVPLLVSAERFAPGAIQSAALLSLTGFAGLTFVAVYSSYDFSLWGGVLRWGGVTALLLIVGSFVFGFRLGTWFSVGMIAFAGASILYDTSKILRRYPEDRYVGAALELFSSVALLFWYVLRLVRRQ